MKCRVICATKLLLFLFWLQHLGLGKEEHRQGVTNMNRSAEGCLVTQHCGLGQQALSLSDSSGERISEAMQCSTGGMWCRPCSPVSRVEAKVRAFLPWWENALGSAQPLEPDAVFPL